MTVKTTGKAILSTFGHCQIREQQKNKTNLNLYSCSNIEPNNVIFALKVSFSKNEIKWQIKLKMLFLPIIHRFNGRISEKKYHL